MRILLINQVFWPDVAATAQYASPLAAALASRGHEVTVFAADQPYDRSGQHYPRSETWKSVGISRIFTPGLGKRTLLHRLADFLFFFVGLLLKLAFMRPQDVTIALTTPPLIGFLAAAFSRMRGGRFVYWVMDLNPDQAIAAGILRPNSLISRVLEWMLRSTLRSADTIVVLDRFMKARIQSRRIPEEKIAVIPPWALDDHVRFDAAGREAFRSNHGLEGKFVVSYSGNHSPCHPMDTILEAALRLRDMAAIHFLFVGGGAEYKKVQGFVRDHNLANVTCLPYQPLEKVSASLSAADLQLVILGDPFVGIVHPCKIYNLMRIGLPVLYVGPAESHMSDLANAEAASWLYSARNGDVDAVTQSILEAAKRGGWQDSDAREAGERFGQECLLPQFVQIVERCGPGSLTANMTTTSSALSGD